MDNNTLTIKNRNGDIINHEKGIRIVRISTSTNDFQWNDILSFADIHSK